MKKDYGGGNWFSGSHSYVLRMVKNVDLKYIKYNDRRKFVMEEEVMWQHEWNFLRQCIKLIN